MPSTQTDRLTGLTTSVAVKPPCIVAAIANITLSGVQTVNSVAVVAGDRVLATAQTNGPDNLIWIAAAGPWEIAADSDGSNDLVTGTMVLVKPGTAEEQFWVLNTTGDIVPGTTSLEWVQHTPEELALRGDLASSATTPNGDGLIAVKRTFTGAVATTEHAWHEAQTINLVADLLVDKTGAVDCTTLVQSGVTAGNIIFIPGTYTLSGDISIPANRKIIVEKGATITNTGGRFTAYDVDNVEWHIDGWVKSVSMTTAADKTGWEAGSRGFIEFGDNYSAGNATSGFWVHGTGKVSGDWTGTPNVSDLANQINRKGIACYNSANVLVEGMEVFGFHGEAVYAFFFDDASQNIVFRNNNVHDTRFNALNFNAAANGGGCLITHNRAESAYQVEISAGECSYNDIRNMVNIGIYTGSGAGLGPVTIRDNYIEGTTTLHGIAAIYNSATPVTGVTIQDNTILNSGQYSIYADYVRELTVKGNTCIGTGTDAGGYDIGINHTLRGSVNDNTFMAPGGGAQADRIAVDANTFDVTFNNNHYMATTGTAPPVRGSGVVSVASATAVTLPFTGDVFFITGTTAITSVVATNNNGRTVTLIFEGVLNFTDGSNLKLASTLATTADDTITIVCNGTNWYEVSRSVN